MQDSDLRAELNEYLEGQRRARILSVSTFGPCVDCLAPATAECPDDEVRCDEHAIRYAKRILGASRSRFVNRLDAHGKKARAKRRAATKAARKQRRA